MKKVLVIGAGPVGFINALGLAYFGHQVTCFDRKTELIQSLQKGILDYKEAGLEEFFHEIQSISWCDSEESLPATFDVAVICVGTPQMQKKQDLEALNSAMRLIAKISERSTSLNLVVIRSTVLPGTTDSFAATLLPKKCKAVMMPEFLREGQALNDFFNPDRVIAGVADDRIIPELKDLFCFPKRPPWVVTNPATAEFTKYASNALLAVQISTANELAGIAETIPQVDFLDTVKMLGMDSRWAEAPIMSYLSPGLGFGGACLPKDLQALSQLAKQQKVPSGILQQVKTVNDSRIFHVAAEIQKRLQPSLNKKILVLGFSFKANTNDTRESKALELCTLLLKLGFSVMAHDPQAQSPIPEIEQIENWQPEVSKAAAIVIATDWSEYRELENLSLGSVFIFDCRRLLKPNKFEADLFWAPGLGPRTLLSQLELLDQAANDRGVGLISPMREPLVHGLEPELL